ncbi:MAG TPA: alpha/beta hydrolase [Actinomycetes bacterium]|nr:alpha/beta hydrolase [Actinomycetes bacterium]
MNPAQRAGVAGVALVAAAVGATAGFAAERVVVGRRLRKGVTSGGRLGLGQLRGPTTIVRCDDGVELHVEVEDAHPSAPWRDLTVVFVHGYALNQDCFHFQRLALHGSARLVFYDQRSHGRSGRGSSESATLAQLARDLRSVIDEVAPTGPLVLVGHSMGGMTILELGRVAPELFGDRIVGVALIATSAGEMEAVTLGLPAIAMRTLRKVAPSVIQIGRRGTDLIERGRALSSDLALLVTKFYAFDADVPVELVDFSLEMINATPVDVLADFYPTLLDHDAFDSLDSFNGIETLVVVGERDLLTPSEHSRALVRGIPGAELEILDPGGHLVMLERPDDVNALLIDLLERVARGLDL